MPERAIPSKLTIVQLSPEADRRIGDYVYRIGQPAEAMARIPGVAVVNLSNACPHIQEVCLAADVLVLHLIGEHNLLPLVEERKKRGLPTVYEISDNFLALPPWVPFRRWFQDPANLATTFQLIRMSDGVQGVSEFLLEQFGFLHDRRLVFENQVMDLPPLRPKSGSPFVIGWAGSLGHTHDIARIAPPILEICQNRKDVRFAFMGNREQYERVFGREPQPAFSYREPGSLEDYYAFLEGLDIGLAPLDDTAYNLCRSDVKFLEYASRGAVPVLSDLGPYRTHVVHGQNGFLFQDPASLSRLLDALLNDPERVMQVRENAYRYVQSERQETAHADRRVAFYRGLQTESNTVPFPWHLLERISERSELYAPKRSSAEEALLQGTSAAARGDRKEALECWIRAGEELPAYELAHICAGRFHMEKDEAAAVACFQKALAANPDSLLARLLRGRALGKARAGEAQEVFEQALEVFPDFAPAWHELGLMERDRGRLDKAVALLNRALEANPFYAEAAYALGGALQAQGRNDTALQALGVALDLLPDREDYQVALIELLAKTGRPEEAAETGLAFLKAAPQSARVQEALRSLAL